MVVAEALSDLQTRLSRVRHQARHLGVAALLSTGSRVLHRALPSPVEPPDAALRHHVTRGISALVERDLANVAAGRYPAALLHFPLIELLRAAPELLLDLPQVALRMWRKRHVDLPPDVDVEAYPPYYRRNFHWQTDGWLSEHSARLYDLEVDLLFWGTTDLMRRMLLPPLTAALGSGRGARVLDVACGTGRFLRQLQGALPEARLYGVDLSPFYVEQARRTLGNPSVSLSAENAEALPFADGFFDAVTSTYLLHELPRHVRRNVLREARRVLKPGGLLVLGDSFQQADESSRELRYIHRWFPGTYHEPYYKDYVRDDLAALAGECGFASPRAECFLLTKVLTARA